MEIVEEGAEDLAAGAAAGADPVLALTAGVAVVALEGVTVVVVILEEVAAEEATAAAEASATAAVAAAALTNQERV